VTGTLAPALERAISSPALAAKLKPLGILVDYSGPEKMLAEIRAEHRRRKRHGAAGRLDQV